jgi:hypothetical protein
MCFPTMNPTGCMLFHSLIPCDFVNEQHLRFSGSENPTGLNIEIQINTTSVIYDMGQLWLIPWKVTPDKIQDLDVVPILQSTQGTQLQPGQHLHGLVGFSQRRVLARTALELLGFPAVSAFDWTWAVISDSNFQNYINYSQLPISRKCVSLV